MITVSNEVYRIHIPTLCRFVVALNRYEFIREAFVENAVAMAGRPDWGVPGYNVNSKGEWERKRHNYCDDWEVAVPSKQP